MSDTRRLQLNIPFEKVDREHRIVSGFATVDSLDKQGHVVDASASIKAFSNTQAKIRSMHDRNPVGKIVSFEPREIEDPKTNKTYKGVFVQAYISKTEEAIWTKIEEGILTGFSIGGRIHSTSIGKDSNGDDVTVIKEYSLDELSLVDNPANELANVLSFVKSADGESVEGLATKIDTVNVHYNGDEIVLSDRESIDGYKNVGWVERAGDEIQSAKKLVANLDRTQNDMIIFKQDADPQEAVVSPDGSTNNRGGAEMTDKTETVEAAEVDEAEVEDTDAEAAKAADVTEVEAAPEFDPDKLVADLTASVTKSVQDALSDVRGDTEAVRTDLEEKVEQLSKDITEDLTAKLEDLKSRVSELGERVDRVDASTAVKKSADKTNDDDEEMAKETGGFWGRRFISSSEL